MPIANTCSIGYPHDGRADNAAYRHDRRADNAAYRHDRRADSLSLNFEVSLENETPGRFNQRPVTCGGGGGGGRGGIFVGDFNYPGINWTNLTTETGIDFPI